MKEPKPYSAEELFKWVTDKNEDFLLLDVRNEEEFGKFKVEAPYVKPVNVPYIDFTLDEEGSVEKVPAEKSKPVKIVCSKEGSAKYVAEILIKHGFEDVGYLLGGIKSWGNVLIPKLITGESYSLYQFIRPGKGSLSYGLLYGGEMFVFDPSRNVEFYKKFAEEHKSKITKTFETHLQADYISGSRKLAQDTGAEIIGNENDFKGAGFKYTPVNDGDTFTLAGGPVVKAIHTPGHTPGSTSYLIDDKYLLTGDTIFISSIGRPDLGGMVEDWSKMLFNTLKNKIEKMDDNLFVLPGHYLDWSEANEDLIFMRTLKEVKERNAEIFKIQTEEEFIKFIKAHMQEQPEVYARIRKFNAGLSDENEEEQEIMDIGKHKCAISGD
ncbi:MAG: MBL fold metallo-hydrolase [Nitrospirae bacterium]|nr:MAG: MBL fold metallo-hydrolase [Nitrospirota bacterium]